MKIKDTSKGCRGDLTDYKHSIPVQIRIIFFELLDFENKNPKFFDFFRSFLDIFSSTARNNFRN